MDLTNETHGHRWYRRGRGLARGFFSVRPCRSIPDEGCISLIVSFPSMAFVQLFNLNLFDHHLPILFEPIFPTSRRYYRSLFFLSPLSLLFSPFFVHVWPACENDYRASFIFSSRYLLSSHSLSFSSSYVSLFQYSSGTIDTGGGHVSRLNCGTTCFSEFINNSPSIETWKNAIVFPLSNSLSFSFYFLFISLNSPKFLKECKYRRSSIIISIGYLIT